LDKNGEVFCEFFGDGSCNVERIGLISNSTTYKTSENGKLTLYNMYDQPWGPIDFAVDGNKLFLRTTDTSGDNYLLHKKII